MLLDENLAFAHFNIKMDLLTKIDRDKLPQHLAIIMDGNGRWAKKQGLLRAAGHKRGTQGVKQAVEGCAELGIPYLTLYAFSTENWNRPKKEVDILMNLLVSSLKKEIKTLQENDVSLHTIGNIDTLPKKAQKELQEVIKKTKSNKRLRVTLALSYGGREEILKSIQEISIKVKNNIISPSEIDESLINNHLYTHDMPDVDLLIRTSGEQRVNNFLLWQIAYAEFYFTPVLWPDFKKEDLHDAIYNYQKRERRFGKTSEQIN